MSVAPERVNARIHLEPPHVQIQEVYDPLKSSISMEMRDKLLLQAEHTREAIRQMRAGTTSEGFELFLQSCAQALKDRSDGKATWQQIAVLRTAASEYDHGFVEIMGEFYKLHTRSEEQSKIRSLLSKAFSLFVHPRKSPATL